MKRPIYALTLAFSLAFSDGKYEIPVPNCEGVHYDFPFAFKDVNNKWVNGMHVIYDSNCDGELDLGHIILDGKKDPLLYMIDKNKGDYDEFYLDKKQDGLNGNEVKCKSIDECISLGFSKKTVVKDVINA